MGKYTRHSGRADLSLCEKKENGKKNKNAKPRGGVSESGAVEKADISEFSQNRCK
jgi:hypothetical protein